MNIFYIVAIGIGVLFLIIKLWEIINSYSSKLDSYEQEQGGYI